MRNFLFLNKHFQNQIIALSALALSAMTLCTLTLCALTLVSCGKLPTTEPGQPFAHFIGDFEKGNLQGWHFLVPDTSVNTVVVDFPVRRGHGALKNTLRPDDHINNGYRAELSVYDCARYRTEVFYGWSFMIDTGYSEGGGNLIAQWQDLPNYAQGESWESLPVLHGSPPPIALIYEDKKIVINMNDTPNPIPNTTFSINEKTEITKGHWYDIVFHMYWNDDNSAFVEAWLDGKFITPFNGVDNKYYQRNLYTRNGNYFKFGQYRGSINPTHTNIIFLDEMRVGASYQEVAP